MSRVRVSALAVGDKLPDAKLTYFDAEGNMKELSIRQLGEGKKVVLFAVPGAFTPTCSLKHLPGFIEKADELKAKGVNTVACVSVNDAFVMVRTRQLLSSLDPAAVAKPRMRYYSPQDAWGKAVGADDKVLMLADGSAQFTKALGVELDLTDRGLGIRSRRYAMLVDNLEIKILNLEEGGAFTVSSADEILKQL